MRGVFRQLLKLVNQLLLLVVAVIMLLVLVVSSAAFLPFLALVVLVTGLSVALTSAAVGLRPQLAWELMGIVLLVPFLLSPWLWFAGVALTTLVPWLTGFALGIGLTAGLIAHLWVMLQMESYQDEVIERAEPPGRVPRSTQRMPTP